MIDSEIPANHLNRHPKGSIVFFHMNQKFDGNTIHERALGGMETSIIYMARELAELGWDVKVFNHCEKRGTYEGVEYVPVDKINEYKAKYQTDVFISVRYLDPFLADLNSKLKILWTGDACDQPFLKRLKDPKILENIDKFFTKSEWQAQTTAKFFDVPFEKFFVAKNGVNVENFLDGGTKRQKAKLIYASTPFRGLDVLLDIFPEIKSRVPSAELHVFSGLTVYGISGERDRERYGHIYSKANQPGVHMKGNVIQEKLRNEMMSSWLMVYPCTFPETLAGVTLEAQAAGLPVITTKAFALPEVIKADVTGLLIDGNPRDADYQSGFVNALVELIHDDQKWHTMSENAKRWIFNENTRRMAALEWEAEFLRHLQSPVDRLETVQASLAGYIDRIERDPTNWRLYAKVAEACDSLGKGRDAEFFREKAAEIRSQQLTAV